MSAKNVTVEKEPEKMSSMNSMDLEDCLLDSFGNLSLGKKYSNTN